MSNLRYSLFVNPLFMQEQSSFIEAARKVFHVVFHKEHDLSYEKIGLKLLNQTGLCQRGEHSLHFDVETWRRNHFIFIYSDNVFLDLDNMNGDLLGFMCLTKDEETSSLYINLFCTKEALGTGRRMVNVLKDFCTNNTEIQSIELMDMSQDFTIYPKLGFDCNVIDLDLFLLRLCTMNTKRKIEGGKKKKKTKRNKKYKIMRKSHV